MAHDAFFLLALFQQGIRVATGSVLEFVVFLLLLLLLFLFFADSSSTFPL